VGVIKIKLHRPVAGTIKTVSIKREAGRWFVIFSVEGAAQPLPLSGKTIGIDLGLTSFAALSDGSEIDNPRLYREAQRRLRVAQRRVARRTNKRSNRRRKAVTILHAGLSVRPPGLLRSLGDIVMDSNYTHSRNRLPTVLRQKQARPNPASQ
jgi:hypothetical protein